MPPPYVTAPDPEFTNHIATMESTSLAAYKATLLIGQRQWMYPPVSGWSGHPYDIVGLNTAFDRSHLNSVYVQIMMDQQGAGNIGESMAVKLQVDYIAALERAFRTRYCSSIRAKLHAASRKQGQSDSTAGLFSATVTGWILNIITAAHDSSDCADCEPY